MNKIIKRLLIAFCVLIVIPALLITMWNYNMNPEGKYRADHATSTGHRILIDDHFRVITSSGKHSLLVYEEIPDGDTGTYDEVFSIAVDKLNWDDNYIMVSAVGHNGNSSYQIINRDTLERDGYANEEEFEQGKQEKGITVDLKEKKYFDWH